MFYNVYGLIFNFHNTWGPLLPFVIVSKNATCSAMYESYGMKNSPIQTAIQYKKQTKQKNPQSQKKPTPKPCNSIYIHKLNHLSTSRSLEGVKGVLDTCEGSYVGLWWDLFYFYSSMKVVDFLSYIYFQTYFKCEILIFCLTKNVHFFLLFTLSLFFYFFSFYIVFKMNYKKVKYCHLLEVDQLYQSSVEYLFHCILQTFLQHNAL